VTKNKILATFLGPSNVGKVKNVIAKNANSKELTERLIEGLVENDGILSLVTAQPQPDSHDSYQ
jgi:hypothetical protein